MKSKLLLVLSSSIFLLNSFCSPKNIDTVTIKSETIQIDSSYIIAREDFSSLIADLKIIPLESRNNSFLSEVVKIRQIKNRYVLQDKFIASTVVAFDSTGNFICSYGKKGRQPGDYVLPMDFTYREYTNELVVLNSEVHKINYYDFETGSFRRSKKYITPLRSIIMSTDNSFIGLGAAKESRVVYLDSNFVKRNEYINYEPRFGVGLINNLQKVSDSLIIAHISYNDTIYALNNDQVVPYLIIDFKNLKVDNGFYKNLSRNQLQRIGNYIENKMSNISVYAENTQTRVFRFSYQRIIHYALQDKVTKRIKVFSNDSLQDDLFGQKGFPLILGVDADGYFLSVISPEKLLLNFNSQRSLASSYSNLIAEKIKNITLVSNPILIRFKIHNF